MIHHQLLPKRQHCAFSEQARVVPRALCYGHITNKQQLKGESLFWLVFEEIRSAVAERAWWQKGGQMSVAFTCELSGASSSGSL